MGIVTFILLFFITLLSFLMLKGKIMNPINLFLSLWMFIIFLSILNLYGIYTPSNETYILFLLMIFFFFLGGLFGNKVSIRNSKMKPLKNLVLKKYVFNILYYLVVLFTLIDVIIVIKSCVSGIPFSSVRRWAMGAYGIDNNPILNRRSFIEEAFRSIILSPFSSLIHPICAYMFFNETKKKNKIQYLLKSIFILLITSISSGGGRLGFIYFIGCYLLAFLTLKSSFDYSKKIFKKYKNHLVFFSICAFIIVVIFTNIRSSSSFIIQVYKYFAMAPTLFDIWLPKIKTYSHTYGLLTTFGIHSYFFRFLNQIGLSVLVPNIYNDCYSYILAAEEFKQIGIGVGNAFVSPLFYFYIDGGPIFIIFASFLFGLIISRTYKKILEKINIQKFTSYCLIMYGVFISFIRVQTVIPSYIISFFLFLLIFKNIKGDENEK